MTELTAQIDEAQAVRRQFMAAKKKMLTNGQLTDAQFDQRLAAQASIIKTLQYLNAHRDTFLKVVREANANQ